MDPPTASNAWSSTLWTEVAPTYQAILGHDFIAGLTSGRLPREVFLYYLAQDAQYLDSYARALTVIAAKAPTSHVTRLLASHAAEAIAAERALHVEIVQALEAEIDSIRAIPAGPTTVGYANFVLAAAHSGGFAEGLAALLPCYWIYAKVAQALRPAGSPVPGYQLWIDAYAGDEYADVVAQVLEVADAFAPPPGAVASTARSHFATAARYEWMFWDAAWRTERWPRPGRPSSVSRQGGTCRS